MTRGQFLRRLRKYCRKFGLSISVEESRGKGSHVTVEVGELSPIYIKLVLRQLGLPDGAV